MKQKNKRIWIIIIICATISLIITMLTGVLYPGSVASFKKDYPTQEEYLVLKEYSIEYVKTLDKDIIRSENINISHSFENNSIIVTVIDVNRCKIEASYPIRIETLNDGKFITSILFEEAQYKETSYINSKVESIFLLVVEFIGITALLSIVMYEINSDIVSKIKKKKTN